MKISTHVVHPITALHCRKNHPWITADKFSLAFKRDAAIIHAVDAQKNHLGFFLHDPKHPQVKARLWETNKDWHSSAFEQELESRFIQALKLREQLLATNARDNCYLIFGEADLLPGLIILKLKDDYIFQIYCGFWQTYQNKLKDLLLKSSFQGRMWWQDRTNQSELQSPPSPLNHDHKNVQFHLQEFGVNYQIDIGTYYDYGIYTDMSALRAQLSHFDLTKKNVLNLYSYTGAFSLWAKKLGAEEVYTVDLSSKYLDWFRQNLELNPTLHTKQTIIQGSVISVLKQWNKNHHVDFIICDPPSFSSDGNKSQPVLKTYEQLFPLFEKILSQNGHVLTFINTHTINWDKYLKHMKKISPFQLVSTHDLGQDCPIQKSFPEGRYLKGILWSKIKSSSTNSPKRSP